MINPNWLTIVEVIASIAEQPYACPVNKTMLQNIPYILTEQGVETGFTFSQGDFGLASISTGSGLRALAYEQLITEYMVNRTTFIQVDASYAEYRSQHQDILNKYAKKITRTVDLFSRIKDTKQAEEVITVLFTTKMLKKRKASPDVSEKEVMNYIVGWRRKWSMLDKYNSVVHTMRQLQELGWVRIEPSFVDGDPSSLLRNSSG
jgi:hypothetical protein